MIKAFHACGPQFDRCSEEQVISILKDTAYLMSRTDDHREERVFFKFQSSLSTKIRTFQKAFPDIPWLYSYREPVQVMMSHIKDDPAMVSLTDCRCSKRIHVSTFQTSIRLVELTLLIRFATISKFENVLFAVIFASDVTLRGITIV